MARDTAPPRATMRLDKWLVHARFCKTRSVAADLIESGHMRVNGIKTRKTSFSVGGGDTLTFPQGDRIRVIRVLDLPERRGPASEARMVFADLAEDVPQGSRAEE